MWEVGDKAEDTAGNRYLYWPTDGDLMDWFSFRDKVWIEGKDVPKQLRKVPTEAFA